MLKQFKLALAVVLALVLGLASVSSAFAAGDPVTTGTPSAPMKAAITKMLKVPAGTAIPAATFTFNSRLVSVDDVVGAAGPASLANLSVSFNSSETSATSGGVSSVVKETGNIFAGITFPHAGVYVYEITENANTNPSIDSNINHETLTYSGAKYTLTVYVKADGGQTYVWGVGDVATFGDDGLLGSGDKVDPTPGGEDGTSYSKMIFTNIYTHTNGSDDPDNPDPATESSLIVSKTVTGEFGSQTQYFDYTMDLALPSLVATPPAFYRAYVVEGATVVTSEDNAAAALLGTDAGGTYIKVALDRSTTFSLKHGQKLVFVDTPVGTTYSVKENGTLGYQAKVTVTTNTIAAAPLSGPSLGAPVSANNQTVGESVNRADFVNDRSDVTPMGLNLADLPFIGMIIVAVGALVVFVALKLRRRGAAAAAAAGEVAGNQTSSGAQA